MAEIRIEKIHGPAARAVVKGLREFNEKTAGKADHRALSITLRNRGAIVGGLVGESYFGWLFIRWLWIADKFRGKGFGAKIMKSAEDEARNRGVKHIYVDTFSFQAPGFYEKLGYREFGRLNDFPAGHFRAWLVKAL